MCFSLVRTEFMRLLSRSDTRRLYDDDVTRPCDCEQLPIARFGANLKSHVGLRYRQEKVGYTLCDECMERSAGFRLHDLMVIIGGV